MNMCSSLSAEISHRLVTLRVLEEVEPSIYGISMGSNKTSV